MRTAIIDIGSNSVRLLILNDGQNLFSDLVTTGLGKGLAGARSIFKEQFDKSIKVVCDFFEISKMYLAKAHIFATEAVRTAENGKDFCESIFEKTKTKVHVLSGEEEAEIGFLGAIEGRDHRALVIDIGGASTELAVGEKGKTLFSTSYKIGAVKLFERCKQDKREIVKYIDEFLPKDLTKFYDNNVIAIGGTATALALVASKSKAYDKNITHNYPLTTESLKETLCYIEGLLDKDMLTSIKKERREIIFGGGILLKEVMERVGIKKLRTSECDGLIGYYKKYLVGKE